MGRRRMDVLAEKHCSRFVGRGVVIETAKNGNGVSRGKTGKEATVGNASYAACNEVDATKRNRRRKGRANDRREKGKSGLVNNDIVRELRLTD